ncbi:MAG TPA: DUF1186 domain-containing protein [Burkholderiaceae bacterium]|nr:DUF1186 domain-containing protein [Burkholderiaceae bacterium]HMX12111.1 DUF1186 domain-containing protein [Burkholderiaceae bacterium]HMY99883.1 DUF1186 domain-containing protein [Burkholderiaceae bacterium]HNB44229.1 DUF1186 domain-containing protein [Burkholderiaceae bacterium]HNG81185.1 DUF1186 domain-containing protein [Burkholderiaceae bacterium]
MNATPTPDPDLTDPSADAAHHEEPWQRLCRELSVCEPPYPTETVRWAQGQREALAPHFLALLERVARDPAAASEDDANLFSWGYVYLAVWRDLRAWEPMLALLRQPTALLDELLGDMIHECYGRALASVCPGDVAPLRALAQDESASVWTRMAVLDAWRLRVQLADAPQAELEDVLLTLGENCAAELRSVTEDDLDEGNSSADYLLADVIVTAGELQSQRLQPAVYRWFDEGLVDPMVIRRGDYDADMRNSPTSPARSPANRYNAFVDDPVEETRWWGCWQERSSNSSNSLPFAPTPLRPQFQDPAPTTFVRPEPKVGRNDPCPCGSGKKYKKCHGAG